jgi:hypothetical protein
MSDSSQAMWTVFGPVIFAFLAFIGVIVFVVVISIQKRNQTKQDYEAALDQYRGNPTDQRLRQSALEAGRLYSRNTANGYGNFSFDELAIRNDLDSIAMAATRAPEPTKPSIEARFQTLDSLLNRGIITETEYQNRRAAILDEV